MRLTLAVVVLAGMLLVGCAPSEESATATPSRSPVATSSPSPVATTPGSLSIPALKYVLLDRFSDFFYCDPDYYPIGRGDEQEKAIERFPAIRADAEEFAAISAHLGLPPGDLTPEQQLHVYREHKKLAALVLAPEGGVYRFELRVSQEKGSGQSIQGTIDRGGVIKVTKTESAFVTCPICLARGTLIDTPAGQVPVEELRPGMLVWTVARAGERIASPIEAVAATSAPSRHAVVRVDLDDGRAVTASPGHPTADGRRMGDLRVGDTLDGGIVVSAVVLRYSDGQTYDLLPAGDTGLYWANGVLLGSSLSPRDAQDGYAPDPNQDGLGALGTLDPPRQIPASEPVGILVSGFVPEMAQM